MISANVFSPLSNTSGRQHKHKGQLAKTANEKSKSLSVSFHTTFLI